MDRYLEECQAGTIPSQPPEAHSYGTLVHQPPRGSLGQLEMMYPPPSTHPALMDAQAEGRLHKHPLLDHMFASPGYKNMPTASTQSSACYPGLLSNRANQSSTHAVFDDFEDRFTLVKSSELPYVVPHMRMSSILTLFFLQSARRAVDARGLMAASQRPRIHTRVDAMKIPSMKPQPQTSVRPS